jgi:hypothetical protein
MPGRCFKARCALAGLALVLAVGGASCESSSRDDRLVRETRHALRAPQGFVYLDALWLTRDRLVVTRATAQSLRGRLVSVSAASGVTRVLPTTQRPDCATTGAQFPTTFGRAVVAYLSTCFGGDGTPDHINEIRGLNLRTGFDRRLRPYNVPPFSGGFTFRTGDRLGVINDGHGLRERLRWLNPRAMPPLPIRGLRRAGTPSWSADGHWLGYDAIASGSGAFGPRALFVSPRRDLTAKRVIAANVSGITGAGVTWIPGHPWLIFAGQPRGGAEGLWAISAATRRMALVLRGSGFGRAAIDARGRLVVPRGLDADDISAVQRNDLGFYRVDLAELSDRIGRSSR